MLTFNPYHREGCGVGGAALDAADVRLGFIGNGQVAAVDVDDHAVGLVRGEAAAQLMTVQVDGHGLAAVDREFLTQLDVRREPDVRAVGDGAVQFVLRRNFGLRPRPLHYHAYQGNS
ncbi:MAG: hypothetical protein IJQ49_06815 [Prevotella sp.]|nr:hypothetical protein [Prevotella sp.]